ncbi:hypothetical protein [Microbacterium hominis]|uniref:hypothetical protein n=1 Tax=Microbacterium hominis TaxID=162426 RepID=UPI0012E05F8F|nr:hypothetical protein [Microbacterium hominis]
MANIAPTVINLNDVVLTIGSDNYELSVSKVELVPTTPTITWRGMSPAATYNVAGSPTWVLNLDFAQDFATANSLSNYTFANQGSIKTVTFKPKKGTSVTQFSIDVLIVATTIGGSVDTAATASASFTCNGQPTKTTV